MLTSIASTSVLQAPRLHTAGSRSGGELALEALEELLLAEVDTRKLERACTPDVCWVLPLPLPEPIAIPPRAVRCQAASQLSGLESDVGKIEAGG